MFIECIMFRMLHVMFLVLEVSSVCLNVVLSLSKAEDYLFFCLLGVMRMLMPVRTRHKEYYVGDKFTSYQIILFFKLKVRIRTENVAGRSIGIWQKVSDSCAFVSSKCDRLRLGI